MNNGVVRKELRGSLVMLAVAWASLGSVPSAAAKGGLSAWVMRNAREVSKQIHGTGGYRFDGWNDCYGFVKRTWNPVLSWLKKHHVKGPYPRFLPVGDYPSKDWAYIDSWDMLLPGDVLGTVQGHRGGADVDYGLYAGKDHGVHIEFSNGGGSGPSYKQHRPGWFRYYYRPTHALLKRIKK